MGADIRNEGHHAVVRGVAPPVGAPVRAPDLRAGAALVLAGLVADGETVVSEALHVDRGYEDFAGKLPRLGADVARLIPVRRAERRPIRRPSTSDARRPMLSRTLGRLRADRRSRTWPHSSTRPARATVVAWPGCSRPPSGRATTAGPSPHWRTAPGRSLHRGHHRCARGGEVDPDRPADRRGPGAGRGPRRWPCSPSTRRRRSPAGPSWATASACRATHLDAGVFIRSMATRGHLGGLAVAVPEAIRVSRRRGDADRHRRDGRRRPGGGGGGLGRRHHGGGGQPQVGRRHPGQQGRAAGDGRHLRDQQGGPARGEAVPAGSRADARPVRARRLATPDPRNGGRHRGGGGGPVDRDRPAPGLPGGRRSGWSRRNRLQREFRRVLRAGIEKEVDDLSSRPRFAELETAVAEHRIDPYTAAEELLPQVGQDDISDASA